MGTDLIRYSKLYVRLSKFAAALEWEYRFSFFLEIFVELAYFAVILLEMRVIFWNVTEVAGWSYNELLVLYGVQMVFAELLLGIAFVFNLRSLPEKIANGSLDMVLMKPINSQFAVSLWRPYFAMFPSLAAGIIVAAIGFKGTGAVFNLFSLVPFLVVFGSGLVMAYSLGMMITTLSMWFIEDKPLTMLAEKVIMTCRNPYSVYTGWWKVVFLTVVPVAFMVSFPTSVLLGEFEFWWLPAAIVLAAVFLFISNRFWNFALKKYSGASG